MVELRKRKTPTQPPVAEKKSKPAPKRKEIDTTNQAPSQKVPQVEDILDLASFGGEFETNDGTKTTLKKLVEESTSGVVLFTYPKASTPGCTFVAQPSRIASSFHHISASVLTFLQAPSRLAYFVITTLISHHRGCLSTVFRPIRPKPTPLLRRSRTSPTHSFATPVRH